MDTVLSSSYEELKRVVAVKRAGSTVMVNFKLSPADILKLKYASLNSPDVERGFSQSKYIPK